MRQEIVSRHKYAHIAEIACKLLSAADTGVRYEVVAEQCGKYNYMILRTIPENKEEGATK